MRTDAIPSVVLVVGASGFIGASLVEALLSQGYRVRGTVRDVSNEKKVAPLKSMKKAATNLELVNLDSRGPEDAVLEALVDVEWIFHVASPVFDEDPSKVVKEDAGICAARDGILRMLCAASKTASVQRYILTSSIAAIVEGHNREETPFTEKDWSDLTCPHVEAYAKSKCSEEQLAWDFVEAFNPNFTLTVLNPAIALGPLPSPEVESSVSIISYLLQGMDPAGAIDAFTCIVHIRDVVNAHIQAAKLPTAAGQRFIISQSDGGELFLPDVAAVLECHFGPMGYCVNTHRMPNWMSWLLSWLNSDLAALYPTLGRRYRLDNTLSKEILELEYTSAESAILDCAHSLIQLGIVDRLPGYEDQRNCDIT